MKVAGTLRVPGDKSISHRALMFSVLAKGTSRVTGLLGSLDIRSTGEILRALGATIAEIDGSDLIVHGLGRSGLHAPASALDCGNSGTSARLFSGILAAAPFASRLVGDDSLSQRPMRRVAQPLEAMGARVVFEHGDGLPMTIHGGALRGLTWHCEVASAQVKSAILLAGLVADVPVEVHEPTTSRDHTERMLRARGADVRTEGSTVTFLPRARLDAVDTAVPADPSSAAFFASLAALAESGSLGLEQVCTNPSRSGFFRVLSRMGAQVAYDDIADAGGEPTALVVVSPRRLVATNVEGSEVPGLIDELPVLACV